MPLNTYEIDQLINVLRGQLHVVIGRGRYQTDNGDIIRVIHSYPGVRFLGSVPTPPPTLAGGESQAVPVPTETAVSTTPGLQMKERRPQGGRVSQ
jgi:hypothetical protein